LFKKIPSTEYENDECVVAMSTQTEESKKVIRNKGPRYIALFRRLSDPEQV
jgi:tRNA (guanine-N7-)-methyltransferase